MKRGGATLQGALAMVGLIGAYSTWQREPERAPGEVVVIDITKSDLARVRYEDGAKWVELEPRSGEVWLRIAPRTETKTPERTLRGSDDAKKLFERFAPLYGQRALGALGDAKLKELGLEKPTKRLEVTARGEKRVFLIGTPPLGASDPYVKEEQTGKVFVLGRSTLSELESAATRLVDRQLHAFKQDEFDGLVVSAGGKRREFVQGDRERTTLATLAPKKSPTKPDALAKNWHDKLWRLPATELLGANEQPGGGAPPSVALRIDYTFGKRTVGWIEFARIAPPPKEATTSAAPQPSEVYARTERTVGWAKVPTSADETLKESEKISSGE